MKTREHNLNVRVDESELAMVHALAERADEPVTRLVRRWIQQRYVEQFGVTPPRELARDVSPPKTTKKTAK
jgi:hypothetical protein